MATQVWKISGLLKLGQFATDPVSAENGTIYYNTTDNEFRQYSNGSWSPVGSTVDLTPYFKHDGSVAMSGDINMDGNKVTGTVAGTTTGDGVEFDQFNTVATSISDHLSDTTDAHDATAISVTPAGNLASTDVQAALEELQGDIDGFVGGITDVVQDTSPTLGGDLDVSTYAIKNSANTTSLDMDDGSGKILMSSAVGIDLVADAGNGIIKLDGTVDMSGKKISSMAAGTLSGDAVEYDQLNTALADYLPLTGGSMSGNIAMVGNKVTGLIAGTATGDAVEYDQLGTALSSKADLASPALTGIPTAPTATPLDNSTQIATTAYVDAAVTAGTGITAVVDDTSPQLGGDLDVNNFDIYLGSKQIAQNLSQANLSFPSATSVRLENTPTGNNLTVDANGINVNADIIVGTNSVVYDNTGAAELSLSSSSAIIGTSGLANKVEVTNSGINIDANGQLITMFDDVDMSTTKKITNMADGTSAQDAVTKSQMETADGLKVSKTGDTMSGTLNMGSNSITNLAAGAVSGDAIEYDQFNTALSGKLDLSGGTMTGAIDMSANQINDMADPTLAQDAATKAYVDNAIAGLSWKDAVHVSSFGLGDISISSAPSSIDGHTLNSGERVLLTDQTADEDNGIYVFNGTGNAMTRALDANTWDEIVASVMMVQQGSTNAGTKFVNTNVAGGTLGTTAITYAQFSIAGTVNGTGTSGYNAYWTGAATLSSEQYVATTRGGFGADTSAFTGVVKSSAGTFSASAISNTDIDAAAAIARSKLASGTNYAWVTNNASGVMSESTVTASRAVATDANGLPTASATTATELGYVSGVTSAIQTQLNAKLENVVEDTSPTLGGDLDIGGYALKGTIKHSTATVSEYIQSEYIHNQTLAGSSTNVTLAALTQAYATFNALEFTYSAKEATSNKVRIGKLRVITDGTNIGISDDFAESSAVSVSWDASISGSDLIITYTTSTNNVVVKGDLKRFLA